MTSFTGFPAGKVRMTPFPATFFTDLLPEIDHLGELRTTLYAIWHLDHQEGTIRYLLEDDFLKDERFIHGFGQTDEERKSALRTRSNEPASGELSSAWGMTLKKCISSIRPTAEQQPKDWLKEHGR